MAGSSTGGSLISDAKLKQLYATMLECRLLAQRARRLRRPRRALYAASLGQEAIAVGCVIDLKPEDTVALTPGGSIAALVKGAELSALAGRIYGCESTLGHNIVNGELQLATKMSLTNQQKKTGNVVVAFTTAEATSLAAGQEAIRFAARRTLPIIFVVENKAGVDLALKAPRDGLTWITVDGNDVVAVYRVAYESLQRVRQGGGAVLIEGKPYQQEGKNLRRAQRDPLIHMQRYLQARGLFTARWKDQLVRQFSREIDSAAKSARYLRASP
jgi:TPP-dependent pyruvate/acetoin dehydrogenase alpha subunit